MKSIEVFYETRATVTSIKFANAESYFNVSKPMSYLAKQKIRCILKTIWKTLNKKAYIFSLKSSIYSNCSIQISGQCFCNLALVMFSFYYLASSQSGVITRKSAMIAMHYLASRIVHSFPFL